MSSNVEVPALGESITEAVLVRWHKKEGDRVAVDEPLCELESDKATVDLPAPVGGVLHPLKKAGETVQVGEAIAQIDETAAAEQAAAASPLLSETRSRTQTATQERIQPSTRGFTVHTIAQSRSRPKPAP